MQLTILVLVLRRKKILIRWLKLIKRLLIIDGSSVMVAGDTLKGDTQTGRRISCA